MVYFPQPFNVKNYKPPERLVRRESFHFIDDNIVNKANDNEDKNEIDDIEQFNFKRWLSSLKLNDAWDLIATKYSKIDADEDDEVDIITGEITIDRGHIKNLKKRRFGDNRVPKNSVKSDYYNSNDDDDSVDERDHERKLLEHHHQLVYNDRFKRDQKDLEDFLLADKVLHSNHRQLYTSHYPSKTQEHDRQNFISISDVSDSSGWEDASSSGSSSSDDEKGKGEEKLNHYESDDSVQIIEKDPIIKNKSKSRSKHKHNKNYQDKNHILEASSLGLKVMKTPRKSFNQSNAKIPSSSSRNIISLSRRKPKRPMLMWSSSSSESENDNDNDTILKSSRRKRKLSLSPKPKDERQSKTRIKPNEMSFINTLFKQSHHNKDKHISSKTNSSDTQSGLTPMMKSIMINHEPFDTPKHNRISNINNNNSNRPFTFNYTPIKHTKNKAKEIVQL